MRDLILLEFQFCIRPHLQDIGNIALVGGNFEDPEIKYLLSLGISDITIFGIDSEADILYDLNIEQQSVNKYDLVICSQVLEHVYDIKNAISNIKELTKPNSLIWFSFPASNRPHGSPFYFSAGYHPNTIAKLAQLLQLTIIKLGMFGSKRSYFFTHALRVWPTPREHKHPIMGYNFARVQGNTIVKVLKFLRDIPGRTYACFISSKIRVDIEYATESYVFLQSKD